MPRTVPEILIFRRRLIRWFRRQGRDLAWRRTRDPYRVLVSEVMLQQTQVSRVEEYFPRFLQRYPTIQHLAAAEPAQVREAWEGLGYYRRAANLHRLATVVVAERQGRLPEDLGELRALPGVGRYTAGAVASFAFEQATPAVDTNVERVIRRVFLGGSATRRLGGSAARRLGTSSQNEVWALAQRLVPRAGNAAWTFNQAIMELGALVCTARVARCGICPVKAGCRTGRKK